MSLVPFTSDLASPFQPDDLSHLNGEVPCIFVHRFDARRKWGKITRKSRIVSKSGKRNCSCCRNACICTVCTLRMCEGVNLLFKTRRKMMIIRTYFICVTKFSVHDVNLRLSYPKDIPQFRDKYT